MITVYRRRGCILTTCVFIKAELDAIRFANKGSAVKANYCSQLPHHHPPHANEPADVHHQ